MLWITKWSQDVCKIQADSISSNIRFVCLGARVFYDRVLGFFYDRVLGCLCAWVLGCWCARVLGCLSLLVPDDDFPVLWAATQASHHFIPLNNTCVSFRSNTIFLNPSLPLQYLSPYTETRGTGFCCWKIPLLFSSLKITCVSQNSNLVLKDSPDQNYCNQFGGWDYLQGGTTTTMMNTFLSNLEKSDRYAPDVRS